MRGYNTYYEDEQRTNYGFWLYLIILNVALGSLSGAKAILTSFNTIDTVILCYYFIMLMIGVLSVICFFYRHKITPKLIVAFLAINLFYIVGMSFLVWNYDSGGIDYFGLIRIIVLCSLIIPYLLISKRVKEVFVK
ncbi:DUF2569 family protein [Catalinimonas locisalis]|uniref:DUF2569 family protein n=1 Tax=Catalinimonas locisalis TaxID=3133978 RepID=UPI00403F3034